MITKDSFKALLRYLNFEENGDEFYKDFGQNEAYLKVDFAKEELIYPEDKDFTIHNRTTCNFASNENFVVFECVYRLLQKGYLPQHFELEPKWKVGRGASGGRADILVKDQQGQPLLLIECKTAGSEFKRAWEDTLMDGGQLISYAQQISATRFLCLYASDFDVKHQTLNLQQKVIAHKDNPDILAQDKNFKSFEKANNVEQRFRVWKDTYQLEYTENGIFEANIQAYQIGKSKYTLAIDTKPIDATDKKGKYHRFRTILRKHNIARRENAFEVLVNLFLCKIVDEEENKDDLKFYWKGLAYDNYYSLVDRLQNLYQIGMDKFLGEEIAYISQQQIEDAFWTVKGKANATRAQIKAYFRDLKYFSNNALSFLNVHNERLFNKNAKVLLEIVQMWQGLRLKTEEQNQFLGDMFEYFLDNSIKQSEGQFFTPIPLCKFIVMSLPLASKIQATPAPLKVIDYACGSGHFLTEYGKQIAPLVAQHKNVPLAKYYEQIVGIEKEDRLAKVAKVSAQMYGQDQIQILDQDALADVPHIKPESFDILIANPPFAVEGFLTTLSEAQRERYTLAQITGLNSNTNNIQCFFIERARQLMAPNGVTGIIVPSSVLSNTDTTHVASREMLLKYFDIVSIVELGSGTFGKTGTNTVVLFMRRKALKPEPAEHYRHRVEALISLGVKEDDPDLKTYDDLGLIKQYCAHVDIPYQDYLPLLGADLKAYPVLEAGLLQTEMFQDYQAAFDKSTKTKHLRKNHEKQLKALPKNLEAERKKHHQEAKTNPVPTKETLVQEVRKLLPTRKAALEAKQADQLKKEFLSYVKNIEMDKLYYFILAYQNPQQVLLVKSPTDNKAQKQFLGYEWSGSKGQEGIKYNGGEIVDDIQTPMFDPANPYNPEKINYAIQRNFEADTLTTLPEHCSYAPLTDMLDFSRVEFNKTFSLSPKKSFKIETKWEVAKLEDIAFINPSKKEIREVDENTLVSFVEMASVSDEGFIAEKVDKPLKELKGSYTYFAENDIIIAKITPCMENGKCALAKGLTNSLGMGSSEFHVIRVKPSYNSQYVFNYLNREEIRDFAEYHMTGSSGHRRVPASFYEKFKIPTPPLEIQQKIVEESEEVNKEVEKARVLISNSKLEINEEIDKIYDEGFDLIDIKRLSKSIQYGLNEKMNTVQKGYKVFRMNEIIDRKMNDNGQMKYADISAEEFAKYKLSKGDILFNRTNSIEHVGKTGIFDLDGDYGYASYLIRVIVDTDQVNPFFVNLMMNSNVFQTEAKSKASKAINQANINATIMGNIKIPIPPLKQQKALVKRVEALEKKITEAQAIIEGATTRKQAIMKKYL